ncbi:hypothetical protein Pelo_17924 [Pelomyxa schiedti]|nr:hypothetical protein Pelo_17924 [Pelomyxa schiedti]
MVVTVYEGEWDRDKWHGVGTWVSPDGSGDIYHGQFDHGKKCGTGSILFGAGGGSYVGEWKADVFHGRGARLWANGDRYDGQWVQGKEHGEGTKTWSRDGSSFTGLWEGGVPTKGMRRWPNGDMFEGTFTQVPQEGGGSNCEFHGEGALTLSKRPSGGVGMLKGTLHNNLFQGVSAGVQHQMGSSLPQFEHNEQIKQVTERNNEQHSEQINQVKKNLQQLQEKLQKTQEEENDERKSVLASHPELREAFESAKLLQSQLVTFASEFVLLDESVKKLNDSLQRATESNEELASHLTKLTERKGALVMKLNKSDSSCKKLLGQTLMVQNSKPEIQECARNISTLTKKVLGIKSSATSTYTVPKEEESDDGDTVDDILMKPLLQLQRDNTFTPPFQLLRTLSDTLAQLQRCQFAECTKLADKHTVLSKELSEQVSIGGTLHKAIEDTQRECSELQREHNGKWKLQRGACLTRGGVLKSIPMPITPKNSGNARTNAAESKAAARVSAKKKKSRRNALDSATPPGKAVMETGARADDTALSDRTLSRATQEKTPSASSVSKEVRHPTGATPTTHKEGDRTDAADLSLMQRFN